MISNLSILSTPGLVTFWDFQDPSGSARLGHGPNPYHLREGRALVERIKDSDAPFGPYAARFQLGHWLEIPRCDCPCLNFHGPQARFTIVTWIKREASDYQGCQAVAGMWNEHGRRQYCLFLNLKIWDSAEQAGAHVSSSGGATPGYKYCMEAAIGATPIPFEEWHCVAVSYDSAQAKVFLDGKLDVREPAGQPGRNPYDYPHGIFDPGDEGADFTVGAVTRPESVDEDFQEHGSVVANPFCGLIGGLAVFGRALGEAEIARFCIPRAKDP